jgi:hypothetical protein
VNPTEPRSPCIGDRRMCSKHEVADRDFRPPLTLRDRALVARATEAACGVCALAGNDRCRAIASLRDTMFVRFRGGEGLCPGDLDDVFIPSFADFLR